MLKALKDAGLDGSVVERKPNKNNTHTVLLGEKAMAKVRPFPTFMIHEPFPIAATNLRGMCMIVADPMEYENLGQGDLGNMIEAFHWLAMAGENNA